MRRLALFFVRDFVLRLAIVVAFVGGAAIPQEKPKPPACPPCAPSEVQKLKIENAQLRAGIAQRDLTAAQRAWNEAAAALKAEADAIKKENGWPDDTQFDMQTLKFTPSNNAGLDHKPGPAPPKPQEEKKEKPKL